MAYSHPVALFYARFQLVDFGLAHLEPTVANTKSALMYLLTHLLSLLVDV